MTYEQLLAALGLEARNVSADQSRALTAIADGKVPGSAISERKGRGSTTLKYFRHPWARQLLRDAFGMGYSLETLEVTYHPGPYQGMPLDLIEQILKRKYPWLAKAEKAKELQARVVDSATGLEGSTASALVQLTVYLAGGRCSVFTELGAFDNTMKLNPAFAERSAAARGVCAAIMQAFGLGAEWYDLETRITKAEAWQAIKAQVAALGLGLEAVQARLKGAGFDSNKLGEQYEEVLAEVLAMADEVALEPPLEIEPEPTADPVIDAAKDLGAEVTHAEADMEVALDENGTASDALANTVAEVTNWGEFYDVLGTTMAYPNGTAVQGDINAIFGPTRPQKDGKPDFVKMYNALREWKDATDDKAKDAVIKKYNA